MSRHRNNSCLASVTVEITKYWCPWCGATAHRDRDDAFVSCGRCSRELAPLFGFTPKTLMMPLRPGQDPGPPGAARKSFTFRDPRTGMVRGRTRVVVERASDRPVA
jgi:hypothetical protein